MPLDPRARVSDGSLDVGAEPCCGISRRTAPAKTASEEEDMEAELRRVLEAAFPGEEARYFLPMSMPTRERR